RDGVGIGLLDHLPTIESHLEHAKSLAARVDTAGGKGAADRAGSSNLEGDAGRAPDPSLIGVPARPRGGPPRRSRRGLRVAPSTRALLAFPLGPEGGPRAGTGAVEAEHAIGRTDHRLGDVADGHAARRGPLLAAGMRVA